MDAQDPLERDAKAVGLWDGEGEITWSERWRLVMRTQIGNI